MGISIWFFKWLMISFLIIETKILTIEFVKFFWMSVTHIINGTTLQYSCLENPHGRRSLVGCSPWGLEESDTTERLHFHFSLSCIGGGNGNPFQHSCLENPRDSGAWWAAIYGVTQSRTWLKQLSSNTYHQSHRFNIHIGSYYLRDNYI